MEQQATLETDLAITTKGEHEGDAVHSRNSVIIGKMLPTQYYGTCIAK